MNPYPTHPGFPARVAYAVNALRLCGEGRDDVTKHGETYSRVHSREMDNCFENYDGDAVVWELMSRAKSDAVLMRGIEIMCGNADALEHWKTVAAYRGPQFELNI